MKKPIRVVLLVLLLTVLVTSVALTAVGLTRPRQVEGSGATEAAAGNVSLRATLGEPIVGSVGNKQITLGQGFWHGGEVIVAEGSSIFLPLLS